MQINIFKDYVNTFWKNIDKKIFFGFLLLFILGIFFSFSSTSFLAGERLNKDYYFFFSKHLIFAFFSIFLMIFISSIKVEIIKKFLIPIFILLMIAIILVLVVGVEVKGSRRWLNLIFFRFQPIEFIKPFFILITAKILSRENFSISNMSYFLSFVILLILVVLLANQPDIGQSILLFGTWMSIIFVSGVNLFYIFIFLAASVGLLAVMLLSLPNKFGYIIERFQTFFDPSTGNSFQAQGALDAIKQGGLTGQGMGEGILKDSVPEAHTDYIISVITEEFGSLISILLISIFLYISLRIIKSTILEKEKFIKISLAGLSSILIFQTFIHIGVNTSLLPTTGMTLPFISYGGSSMIGSSILAGIILNFTKKRFLYEEI